MRPSWFNLLALLVLLTGCIPQPWKQNPDVQVAKQDCTGLPQGEHYACIERHAVTSLNPQVCRLASMSVDDACLQAVYQAADDPAICERLYRPGVAKTCRAYYQRPAVDFATSTLINAGGAPGRQTLGYRVVVIHYGNRPVEDLTAWLLFPEAEGLPAQVRLQRTEIAPAQLVQPNQGRVYEGEITWETERSKQESGALLDWAQIRLGWTLDGERQEKLFPLSTEKGPDWGTSVP